LHQSSNENVTSLLFGAASHAASLALRTREVENHTVVLNVVRFQEIINGRTYLIEVLAVERDRWRAQIVRRPGRATAVMPFYGTTADEAARNLGAWLQRATKAAT
jgi:hypothetical protein